MFGLGLALGVMLAGFVGWRAVETYRRGPVLPYRPQQTIWDIERRTLGAMLDAEWELTTEQLLRSAGSHD
jgi:hypothetical protein